MWNRRLLCLAFFLYHLRTIVADGTPPLYIPDEYILLACGSSRNSSDVDGRVWRGDVRSTYFRFDQSQNLASATAFEDPLDPVTGKAPYKAVRFSLSAFTYKFQISPGPKFVRLYFYSTGSLGFDHSNAMFSVKAGPFTLLSNSRPADLGPRPTIYREYCVNLKENQTLNITFIPSANDSFAFINGIEIMSMPPYLYYTSPEDKGLSLVGQQSPFRIADKIALEKAYRVNVGGNSVSPGEDKTDMFRSWSTDDDFFASPGVAVPRSIEPTELNFTKVRTYTAPREVYSSFRTVKVTASIQFNLTWNFPVDTGFNYLVRLYFCGVTFGIGGIGDKVFHIFIADQIVENAAYMIENSVPVYREYVVPMFNGAGEKKINLSVVLNGTLSGIEIFKTSDSKGNLAGSSPYPLPPLPPLPTKLKHNRTAIIAAVGGGIFGFVVLLVLFFLKIQQGKRAEELSSPMKSMKTRRSSPPSNLCHRFSLSKIKAATKDFDQALIVGVGGFGNVYKGYIDDRADPVAIKRLTPGSQQGAQEFETEIEILSRLRHRHLVPLIGYCDEGHEMILIYEYMARGTLRDYLCNTDHPPLPWKQRLEICIGAACGLNYLHKGARCPIIHRDVKTTNILLDEKWVAKVSDFGLSKMGPSGIINTYVSTIVKGTFGYLDPEYFRRQQLSEKSDVYSFGVVMCEVLSGKPPIFRSSEMQAIALAEWVVEWYHKDALDQIVDPSLSNQIGPECLIKFVEIVVSCLHDNGTKRPSMNDVVRDLELALQLQESTDQDLRLDNEAVLNTSLLDGSNGTCSFSCEQDFSEIMNPKGQ